MTRRTVTAALAGGLLVGALAVPAAAGPLEAGTEGDGRTTVCLGLNGQPGGTTREGLCVWVPVELGAR